MNKQTLYAILTIALVPIGILLIFMRMTVEMPQPAHTPVKIVTDNTAYQQIAESLTYKNGHVVVVNGALMTTTDKQNFKAAEVVITDSHQSQLLTQRRKMKLHSKLLIASDVLDNQNYTNYWLSPDVILQTITRLTNLLSDMDPQYRNSYVKNSEKMSQETQLLADKIEVLKTKKNVNYVATNQAQQVFMSQLGYKSVVPNLESLSDDDFNHLEKELKSGKIQFILRASQDQTEHDRRLVKLADNAKIPVITFNQVLPHDQKVWQWQLQLVKQLENAVTIGSGRV
ncbi:3-phosphoglycerate kinase [Leuconostoc carnosum]|uniref:ABC transporter substrate-binding protein n=1 Tax=Leuconostoc carnosum (strain JB16) TaxID=1229758 RepID=K0D925_LEUCJ|nr:MULTISPECIES: zinc ABC transporter substrate-binding protein [Leuconostoc]AFT81295.1 ABC transporter substrate-binding protein [Leuconostoc carnosum JB16]KAA8326627.1 3-phosphoglycerate kinase [Leuconostoc carnosum]KAA8330114.1 3-phosphoglycerate kinase [Leuconostoc carnosum]KAA8362188.1 3-phosphoglycerate kinase [Leuconostoc carnosum]KAA8366737.1 3-phosphoglycerate kinase [Leuconostoc carnosum]